MAGRRATRRFTAAPNTPSNFLPKVQHRARYRQRAAPPGGGDVVAAANTGQIGDGKIFVTPIEHAMRIRTGETDTSAL